MTPRLGLAALRIGDLAAAQLESRPQPGSVESVYRSAVNVATGCGGCVCLQPAGTALHPYAVTVALARPAVDSGAAFLDARPGEAVSMSREWFEFAGRRLSISLAEAQVYDSRLEPPASREAGWVGRIGDVVWWGAVAAMGGRVTSHFLRATMERKGIPLEPDCGLDGLMADATGRRLAVLSEALDVGGVAGLEMVLERMVGFGEGLTPSGDDFLLGLLAAARLTGPAAGGDYVASTVEGMLPTLAASTTRESCRMLEAATAGHHPEAILGLLLAAWGNDREGVRRWAECLKDIGATSGQDMLAGALFWLDGCEEE